ncbi:MAG: branched-chain amino acid transaminase [Leptospiraceae bacterium]|nr:branched-chain amino acid transaminase [Leptospiraceae bacterium]
MSIDLNSIAWFDNDYRPLSECNVNISTHALQYGTMVFGGVRGYYNINLGQVFLFRLAEHCQRLLRSTRIMQMQSPVEADEMATILLELVRRNEYNCNVYFRPFIYKRDLQLSPRLHDVNDNFAIYSLKLDDYLDTTRGMRVCVSSWRRISEDHIPTRSKASGGYINSALAKSEAIQNGFDEAIFLDHNGFVSEGSAENIFIVRDGKLITPPIGSSILEGITRRSIIELANFLQIEVVERNIARSELYICDEAFFCGTGAQVAWIGEIDRRTVGSGEIGPVTSALRDKFQKIVIGEDTDFDHWLSPAYS